MKPMYTKLQVVAPELGVTGQYHEQHQYNQADEVSRYVIAFRYRRAN